MKLCTECMFNVSVDVGYSEFTITGASYECLLRQRDDIDDDGPDEATIRKACEFAETCPAFREGAGLYGGFDGETFRAEALDWVKIHFPEMP